MKNTLLLALLLFLLPGCLNYIQDVNLYPDGSGIMKIQYWMKTPDTTSNPIIDKIGIFSEDSIKAKFSSEFIKIEEISVYTDSTDSTTHAIVSLSFDNIDSLNQTKAFADAQFSFRDGASNQKIFSQFIPPIATGFGIDDLGFKVTYKYTFSGEVIQHNATNVEDRTLIWEYALADIGPGKTISVTFRPYKLKETPTWIFVLSGLVLLTVIFFLFRKKKD